MPGTRREKLLDLFGRSTEIQQSSQPWLYCCLSGWVGFLSHTPGPTQLQWRYLPPLRDVSAWSIHLSNFGSIPSLHWLVERYVTRSLQFDSNEIPVPFPDLQFCQVCGFPFIPHLAKRILLNRRVESLQRPRESG